jgi:hypothetical protein
VVGVVLKSYEETLKSYAGLIADRAMRISGASRAVAVLVTEGDWSESMTVQVDLFERENVCGCELGPSDEEFHEVVAGNLQPQKLPCEPASEQAFVTDEDEVCSNFPSNSGSLAVPLIDSSGESMGLVQVLESLAGDFSPAAESAMLHFSVLASRLIESVNTCRAQQRTIEQLSNRIETLEFDHQLLRVIHGIESRFIAGASKEAIFSELLGEFLEAISVESGLIAEVVTVGGRMTLTSHAATEDWSTERVEDFCHEVMENLIAGDADAGQTRFPIIAT